MGARRVLLLSDGRPGHHNLSEGIVAAIARRAEVAVERFTVRRRPAVPGAVAAALIGSGLAPRIVLQLIYGIDAERLPGAEVIVSAGGETLAANVAAARHLSAANVFYGSLRAFRADWFTLTLTSYAEDARSPHPVMVLKPSALDPASLAPTQPLEPGRLPRRIALLIGGSSGEATFAEADWRQLIDLMRHVAREWHASWLISNSRRTPEPVSDRLVAIAAEREGPIAELIDVRKGGTGALPRLLADADAVVTTADSSSMLSEAVWARRPALALAPARFSLTKAEAGYRRHLEDLGVCRQMPLQQATPESLLAALAPIRPLVVNPQEQLAALLAERLPVLRQGGSAGH